MKYLYVDLETTGINPRENAVIQLAALFTEDDGEVKDKILLDIAPTPESKIDPEALQVIGKTLEEITSYPAPLEQLKVLTEFLQKYISPYDKKDKFLFLAYNAPFDFDFLRQFFQSQGNNFFGSYFWHPPLDVMVLAMNHLKNKRTEMPNFKLSTVAKEMGINVSDSQLHDAYYDIVLTHDIYTRLYPPLHNSSSPSKKSDNSLFIEEEYKDVLF